MIYDASMDALLQKVWEGKRVDAAEARRLCSLPLEELGALAHRRRLLAKAKAYDGAGNDIVTYNIDRNINYTNICNVYCKFCAFYRTEKDVDSYVITKDELDQKIAETLTLGGTQILMQGGHHPSLDLDWYLDTLSHIKSKFPQINIHAFSPSEFIHFQKVFDLPMEDLLKQFKEAGLGSIPGGGGEILVDRVRKRIAPLKAMSDEWMGVMDVAHRLGLNSSATMMFGHVETLEDRIEHLERVRAQQDATGGFTAFIAWTFQSENTKLKAEPVGAHEYLRMQALSRIYLDNVENIQSSWVTQGLEIGQVALTYGANDLGSIMIEENVVSQAGTTFQMTVEDMHRLIKDLGYQPRQRDNWYQLVESRHAELASGEGKE
ncbi:MAG: cyclic dehypoxanthinyl futalosine synthase [Limisphaerales bacterium]|nr:dehypoxanthine futalosine cyclase [Pedosphaera sp.]RZO74202.1 MAG: dehypoxanthine futalosine cyclase [Limisphaerales bacterium]HAQ97860.1 dehypoxanthine futalosine cyclase [Verrucomicrobiales bacterium]HAW01090.1 dehypoxanthine futalosine cyclase [Verrucomicrobiales bacterium]HBP57709.1 dehypoxanthine futalosine cyclase [Verrucomicrobiales bacterium]|tara:strand:- start:7297 stop:8427 length:1131 start_codon:yes stop_codon:yes gene_type:complete